MKIVYLTSLNHYLFKSIVFFLIGGREKYNIFETLPLQLEKYSSTYKITFKIWKTWNVQKSDKIYRMKYDSHISDHNS